MDIELRKAMYLGGTAAYRKSVKKHMFLEAIKVLEGKDLLYRVADEVLKDQAATYLAVWFYLIIEDKEAKIGIPVDKPPECVLKGDTLLVVWPAWEELDSK